MLTSTQLQQLKSDKINRLQLLKDVQSNLDSLTFVNSESLLLQIRTDKELKELEIELNLINLILNS